MANIICIEHKTVGQGNIYFKDEITIIPNTIIGIFCSECKKKIDSINNTHCPHCNEKFNGVNEYRYTLGGYYGRMDLAKNISLDDNDEIKVMIDKKMYSTFEHGMGHFTISKTKTNVSFKIRYVKNDFYIDQKDRKDGENYPDFLSEEYKIDDLELLSFYNSVTHEYDYNVFNKPGEQITMKIDGQILNKIKYKNLTEMFGADSCSQVRSCSNVNASRVETPALLMLFKNDKQARNVFRDIKEPSLKEELALKLGINEDFKVVNPDATTLHTMVGIPKSLLKDLVDVANKKSSFSTYKKVVYSNPTDIINLYHKLKDKYKTAIEVWEALQGDEVYNKNTYSIYANSRERDNVVYLLREGYNYKKLIEYLTEHVKWQQGMSSSSALSNLVDYISMCKQLNIEYDRYPKSLKRTHDVLVFRYNETKKEMESKDFLNYVEKFSDFRYENSKYAMIPVKEPVELIREGSALRHCVGSYANKISRKESMVFFLRDIDNINESLCTIEIDAHNGEFVVAQARGECNRPLLAKEKKILTEWEQKVLSKYCELNKEPIKKGEKATA